MYFYKTELCPFNKEHNKAFCVYAHNWQDFRRKPSIFAYDSSIMCNNWRPEVFIAKYHQGCKNMASCKHSHGWKEQEYHPLVYKTIKCQEEVKSNKKCSRGIECPFFHSAKDKRTAFQEAELPSRSDFPYNSLPEQFLHLSNVNQLQEYILQHFNS